MSGWSGKGQHTTTFAEMFDLSFGGRIINTPGMQGIQLVDISKAELSHYFPEMRDRLNDCQFNNCLHMNRPGCHKGRGEGPYSRRPLRYCGILDSLEKGRLSIFFPVNIQRFLLCQNLHLTNLYSLLPFGGISRTFFGIGRSLLRRIQVPLLRIQGPSFPSGTREKKRLLNSKLKWKQRKKCPLLTGKNQMFLSS
ncbi:MAG: GTPase RsgA [Lewinellaceae bacterium]|nr:GTPase RsgA [Lewinellaceae bacterium]